MAAMIKNKLFLISNLCLIIFLSACSNNGEKKDTSDLYAKSQSNQSIVERSGTLLTGNSANDRKEIMDDAQNRLRTGGGLFGKKAGMDILNMGEKKNNSIASVGLPINPYLWKASLEIINFMPLASADPFSGVIITDWYSTPNNLNERCKINVFIKGVELKTSNLKVNSFCQKHANNKVWVNQISIQNNNIELENAILNKAKKIKLSSFN